MTTLEVAGMMMRAEMAKDSAKAGYLEGESVGVRGDGLKVGGCRCEKPGLLDFGGSQNTQGQIFGISYGSGSITDFIVESFAGAHDFFNNVVGWYDSFGRTIDTGSLSWYHSAALHAANVVFVAPAALFAYPTLIGPYTASYLTNDMLVYGQ